MLDCLGIRTRLSIAYRGYLAQTQAIPVADLGLTSGPAHRPTRTQSLAQHTNCVGSPVGGVLPQRQDPEASRLDCANAPAQELGIAGFAAELPHCTQQSPKVPGTGGLHQRSDGIDAATTGVTRAPPWPLLRQRQLGNPRTRVTRELIAWFVQIDERSEERRVGKECRSRWTPYE